MRDDLASLGRDGFIERYGRYYLVLTDSDSLDNVASFVNTATREGHLVTSSKQVDFLDFRPIVRAKGASGPISVGRDPGCDLSLSHKRVSKLQAHFNVGGGMLQVSDAGSKN